MESYRKFQNVQVLRNVGNLGRCWLPAKYIRADGGRHYVKTIECDVMEILSVDDDCIKKH